MNQHLIETLGTVALAIFSTLIAPAAVEYFKVHVIGKKYSDPIKDELEYSYVINEQLEEIRLLFNADRCWISMYHNGGHYLHSKRSMQKFSIMFESLGSGVSSVSSVFNNITVYLYTASTKELLLNKHIFINDFYDPTINTFGLSGVGEATSTTSVYSIALFDIATNQCIGSLGIDYLDKTILSDTELQLLNQRVQRVAGYLSNFIKSK